MIDFTDCKGLVNSYEGADFKRKIIYDGDVYMLKFGQKLESDERKPMQASYASTPVSEYLGSQLLRTSASQLDKLRVAHAKVRCVAPVIHGGELDAVPPIPLDKVALHPVAVRPQLVQHAPELHGKLLRPDVAPIGGGEFRSRVRPVAVPLRVLALLQRVQHVRFLSLGCLWLNYINVASY